ncbi:MAG: UvrB/UvrC motif-containing protein [Clostridia bacterium]|nr:UvrB/UvrC motif-containing protein [Clostridia bacterium]
MICQRCNKNIATTHIKQVVNGKKHEIYLCGNCAAEIGYGNYLSQPNFNDIFGSFLSSANKVPVTRSCPMCGSTFEEITKHGQVGCMQCYDTFFDKLLPMIQRIHGTSYHKGKKPGTTALVLTKPQEQALAPTGENPIEARRKALKLAIEEQRFEDAAKLRDEIKEMEKDG